LPPTEAPSIPAANTRAIGKEIAPTSGLASQYLDRTEVPMSAEEAAQRTGARARGSKHSLSSIEKKRRMYGRVAIASTLVGAGVVAWHMGREWDSEREKERIGRDVTVEEGLTGRFQRTQARFKDTMDVSGFMSLVFSLEDVQSC
jgi:import inner membrane translocase subunit TIM50